MLGAGASKTGFLLHCPLRVLAAGVVLLYQVRHWPQVVASVLLFYDLVLNVV